MKLTWLKGLVWGSSMFIVCSILQHIKNRLVWTFFPKMVDTISVPDFWAGWIVGFLSCFAMLIGMGMEWRNGE